jgi:thymidylate synthase (FAD)
MEVKIVEGYQNPDEIVCKAARNDYMEGWIGEVSLRDALSDVPVRDGAEEIIEQIHKEHKDTITPYELLEKVVSLQYRLLAVGNPHFGPYEHPQVTFTVKGMSRACMAQLTRHRHVTFDIQSMRYVTAESFDATDIPETDDAELHGQRAEFGYNAKDMHDAQIQINRKQALEQAYSEASTRYNELLDLGVAPENARMVLPIGTKVNVTFSLNARALMHVADMRAAGDAQWEIRQLTEQVLDKAKSWMPVAFTLYEEELKNRKNRLAP